MTHEDSNGEKMRARRTTRQRQTTRAFTNFLARNEKVFNVVSTSVTAIFTVVLATSTVFLWKETKDLRDFARTRSADMKDSIKEAGRAATAMRDVAVAVDASAKVANENLLLFKSANIRQMRAYIIVSFGAVVLQNTETNYRFEVRMTLQNVGNTPAYQVRSNIYARVLPAPLPQDFQFPEFNEATTSGSAMGPHQSNFITGIADRIYSDDELHEIEFGAAKRVCMSTDLLDIETRSIRIGR